jgi:tryptophan-rich sensory protein
VPFEVVDAALSETNTVQQRLRVLPSRVVVYVLLAAALFAGDLVSTVDLIRRARVVDPAAAALLLPYLGWVAFATALNAEIARRNR